MERIIYNDRLFEPYDYLEEKEFEKKVTEFSKEIFGPKSVYIDKKKKIATGKIAGIPDGYLIDFSFPSEPRLYIIEIELSKHDPFKHIGEQLLRFAVSYKDSGRSIKNFLLDSVLSDSNSKKDIEGSFGQVGYRNIDAFLEEIILEKPVAAIIVINESTSDLENVVSQLAMKVDIIEFQTFVSGEEKMHRFTPFQQELREILDEKIPRFKLEELDTIVVPANEEGFNEVFLGENCWRAIRISSSMIDRIKYIAGYQTAPISAITYYAEVDKIEKYKDTGKYIVFFKDKAKKIGPIELRKDVKGLVPYSPRYTNFEVLQKSQDLNDALRVYKTGRE